MSEDNDPSRLAELAMPSEAVQREIERAQQFFRDNEAAIRQVQEAQRFLLDRDLVLQIQEAQRFFQDHGLIRQVGEAQRFLREHEVVARQLVQTAERFADLWPSWALQQLLVRTVGTVMGEFTAPGLVAHRRTASLAVTPVITATARVTPGSDLTVQQAPSTRDVTVENLPSGQAERSIGQIFALVLLWLVVLAVPAAVTATDLSPETQAMLDAYDAMLAALAVKITFRILDKHK
jgi:hypothetical protein